MGEHVTRWEAIPGETPIDPSGLRPGIRGKVRTRGQLNPIEAENIRTAIKKYLSAVPSRKKAPFTPGWALKLHKEMLGKVWVWAGKLRTIELNMRSPPEQVQTDFYNLFADIHYWQESDITILEQAATLHHRAVKIHPFENGNGRWARLLANIWLQQRGHPITRWPETGLAGNESPIRPEYIGALQQADQYDLNSLIALHRRYTADTNGGK